MVPHLLLSLVCKLLVFFTNKDTSVITVLNWFLIAVGDQWLKDVDHKWGCG